jgi:hypothetical protein
MDEHVATRAQQVLGNRETDALRAGGDERAFAEELAHAG